MTRTIAFMIALAIASPALAQSDVSAGPSLLEKAGATVTLRTGLWSSTRELDADGPLGAAARGSTTPQGGGHLPGHEGGPRNSGLHGH